MLEHSINELNAGQVYFQIKLNYHTLHAFRQYMYVIFKYIQRQHLDIIIYK